MASGGDACTPVALSTAPRANANANANAISPVLAYAKLQGEDFVYYVQTLGITIGRKTQKTDDVDVDLGNSKQLSRRHARIEYNFTTRHFELKCLGKNGVVVDGVTVTPSAPPIPLSSRTVMHIGDVCVYFLLPVGVVTQSVRPVRRKPRIALPEELAAVVHDGDASAPASPTGTLSPASSAPNSPSAGPHGGSGADYRTNANAKPPFSYATLIAQAINSTADRRLTLNGIYTYILDHYPYYRKADNGWQNSIRHNLSLNKCFVKQPRPESEPGKGAFWTIEAGSQHMFADGSYKRRQRAPLRTKDDSSTIVGNVPRAKGSGGIVKRSTKLASAPSTPTGRSSHAGGREMSPSFTNPSTPEAWTRDTDSPTNGAAAALPVHVDRKRSFEGAVFEPDAKRLRTILALKTGIAQRSAPSSPTSERTPADAVAVRVRLETASATSPHTATVMELPAPAISVNAPVGGGPELSTDPPTG
eukprot:Opistho-2@40847